MNRGRESEDTGFRHHPTPRRQATVPARPFQWEIIQCSTPNRRRTRPRVRPPSSPFPYPPAIADATGVRSKPAALLAAATALLPELEAGRALDAKTLREAMSAAFGASDAQGAWVWKDAYEAAEAAMVLFIQRYGRLMRREAGAGPGSAAAMLAMLETLAALEPSQTRRSEEQLALQQFSTPLPLAYAALQAAAIRPGDIVLEPSAGTGMLAVMAECALGKHGDGARSGNPLHLNEIAAVRAGLLAGLFAHAPVTRHNAEAIADYLPDLRPTVVLMNPPFSASPGVQRIRHDADLRTSVPPSPCSRRAGGWWRSRRPAASPAMPPGAAPSNGSIRRRAPSFPSPSTGAPTHGAARPSIPG